MAQVKKLEHKIIYAMVGGLGLGTCSNLRNLWIAKKLSFEEFGYWNVVQILLLFLVNTNFGILPTMSNEYAEAYVLDDRDRMNRLSTTGFASSLVLGVVFLLGVSVFLVLKEGNWTGVHAALVAMLFFQVLFIYYSNILRGQQRFDKIAVMQLCLGLFSLGLVLAQSKNLNIMKCILALLTGNSIAVGYVAIQCRTLRLIGFDRNVLKYLIRLGILLFFIGLFGLSLNHLDRILIGFFMGAKALGCYGIGTVSVSIILWLPSTLGVMLMSHFAQGRVSSRIETMNRDLFRIQISILAFICVYLIWLLCFAYGLVYCFVPKYLPFVDIIKKVSIAGGLMALTLPLVNKLIANKQHVKLLSLQLGVLLVHVSVLYIIIAVYRDIHIVPFGQIASYAAYLFGLHIIAARCFAWTGAMKKKLLFSFGIQISLVILAYLANHYLVTEWDGRQLDWKHIGASVGIAFTSSCLVMAYGWNRISRLFGRVE